MMFHLAAFPSVTSPGAPHACREAPAAPGAVPETSLTLPHPEDPRHSQEAALRGAQVPQGLRHGQPRHVVYAVQVEKGMHSLPRLM